MADCSNPKALKVKSSIPVFHDLKNRLISRIIASGKSTGTMKTMIRFQELI